MQDWSLHNSATGGFFQCNRFVSEASGANGGADAEDVQTQYLSQFMDEYGNAQAESMRRKKHTQRVARFIHHFTRFQAHWDSQRMEKRMHKDTIARIVTSLVRSAQGQIQWPLSAVGMENPLLTEYKSNSADMYGGTNSSLLKELFAAFGDSQVMSQNSNITNITTQSSNVSHVTPMKASLSLSSSHENTSTPVPPTSVKHGRGNTDTKKSSLIGALIKQVKSASKYSRHHQTASALPSTPSLLDESDGNPGSVKNSNASDVGGVRLDCIAFLNNGFDELFRCRLVGDHGADLHFIMSGTLCVVWCSS
jgi:hypothetical protein